MTAADTLLLGRASYEGFKSFWPPVADDPDARPVVREISRRNNEIDKVVISDSLTPEQTAEIAGAKQVIYDGFKAAVEAGAPKEKAGILVDEQFGSLTCGRRRSLARTPWPRLRAATASLWAFLKTSAPRLALREGERLAEWETMQ